MKPWVKIVLWGLFGIAALSIFGHTTIGPRPTATATGPTEAEQKAAQDSADQRFNDCKAKLKAAQKLDLLYDLDWKPPSEPRVVVGPTFISMPIDAKEGFVQTVNCFLTAGNADKYINFDVLHWQTGKAIGRFSWGKFTMN